MQPVFRVCADTSVYGGCFDAEFEAPSRRLFDGVRTGAVRLLVSDIVTRELKRGPEHVQRVLSSLPDAYLEHVPILRDHVELHAEYMRAGVLGPDSSEDAMHVAIATVDAVDCIVSWNFKHLVRLDKIRRFNAVNVRLGYPQIEIRSPQEIVGEDEGI